jgi:hypothetical protein
VNLLAGFPDGGKHTIFVSPVSRSLPDFASLSTTNSILLQNRNKKTHCVRHAVLGLVVVCPFRRQFRYA